MVFGNFGLDRSIFPFEKWTEARPHNNSIKVASDYLIRVSASVYCVSCYHFPFFPLLLTWYRLQEDDGPLSSRIPQWQ